MLTIGCINIKLLNALNTAIAGVNSDVWRKIADQVSIGLTDAVTPASIRIHVARNGGDIKHKLGINLLQTPIKNSTITVSRKFCYSLYNSINILIAKFVFILFLI